MLTRFFGALHTLNRLRSGPLGALTEGFAQHLDEAGYSRNSVREYLRTVGHLNHWAKARNISVAALDESTITSFRRHLPRCRCPGRHRGKCPFVVRHLRRLLGYLRQEGVIDPAATEQARPAEPPLVVGFRRWMSQHRGLAQSTVKVYTHIVTDLLSVIGHVPSEFSAQELRAFVVSRARDCSRGWARSITTALRTFLRYLIAEGQCRAGLDHAIPTVADWHLSTLPRYLASSDVELVIGACDPSTPVGRRDHGIVLLLARLALRAGDVVALRLDDIDWHSATIRVSGKARREERLPLPQEVGDAILAYLEHARPQASSDHVFLRADAPARPFRNSKAVSAIVARAIRRAGVVAPCHGAHVLRHSFATEQLRQGASLQSIGAVMRHRSIRTTELYAKVDVALLRLVVQPWPEVEPC